MTERISPHKYNPAPQLALAAKPKNPAPIVHHATTSGGQALDAKTQREMGLRFGHDFSQVRIHTDTRAVESAQSVGANAYAIGGDIVFGAGGYVPGSREGDRLLAHELTHVVQQARHGLGREERLSRQGDASEQEAEALAGQVLAGQSVRVDFAPAAAISRDEKNDSNPFDNPYLKWGGKASSYAPGPLGLLGKAVGVTGDAAGAATSKSTGESVWDGAKAAIGMAGLVSSVGGFSLFGAGGAMGAASTMFGAGGTGLGALGTVGGLGAGTPATMEAGAALAGGGLEGAAALGPAAAVLGAGVAGVGAGIGLDHLSNYAGQKIKGDDKGDYSISNGIAHLMTGADNMFTGTARAVGAYDDSKPAYTQTVGMQMANLFTPTVDASGHEDSFTDRLGKLF